MNDCWAPRPHSSHTTKRPWELAEHQYVYIVQQPEHAGHAMNTLFVDDLDALVAQIADRGLDPAKRETYSNGARKITYRDIDGNEIGFGGAPPQPPSGQAAAGALQVRR
jgi:hypothetical protein